MFNESFGIAQMIQTRHGVIRRRSYILSNLANPTHVGIDGFILSEQSQRCRIRLFRDADEEVADPPYWPTTATVQITQIAVRIIPNGDLAAVYDMRPSSSAYQALSLQLELLYPSGHALIGEETSASFTQSTSFAQSTSVAQSGRIAKEGTNAISDKRCEKRATETRAFRGRRSEPQRRAYAEAKRITKRRAVATPCTQGGGGLKSDERIERSKGMAQVGVE